ncbi:Ak7 [Symbiodinium microadriaticum]|nr:Ak7 [Symbiodinium microadriaticum]
MEEEPLFRHKLADELKMSLWAAFYWECAPVSLQTAKKRLFEFVIKEASHLENAWVDTESFAKYLKPLQGKPAAATFPNLGGSSTLVSPAQDAKMTAEDYKHIGSFLRKASATQHDVVLKAVGDALRERLTRDPKAPFWLNTEGSGVAWLHVRIDPTPKRAGSGPSNVTDFGDEMPISRESLCSCLLSAVLFTSEASDIMHKVTFILISSAGVWARTARGYEEVPVVEEAPEIPEGDESIPPQAEPAEGEEGQPEVPVEVPPPPEPETRPVALRCEDYIRRVPTPKFQDWKDIETQVLALKSKQGGMIRPYVVCAGIPYGNGEDAFLALFKAAWQTRSTLRVIGEGKNYIPMVHARDVARLTRHIIQVGPELDYHLAVDRGEVTQKTLIETVAKQFNLPYEPAPVTVAEAVLAEMADIFTMNIRLEPSPLMEVPWEPPPPEPEEQEVDEEEEAPKPSTSGTALVPPPVSSEGKTKKSRPNSATSQQPAPEADVLEEEEPAAEDKGKEETLPGFRWWSRAETEGHSAASKRFSVPFLSEV